MSPDTRVAIIGAGPAGFFAAESLLKGGDPVAIDLINRLPAPYGLVRDGVAPDHQAIKSVARVYVRILARDEVRYFGNVTLGEDITVEELRARYDQIVYAVGAQSDRHLGIPGEDLEGSHAAFDFVGWYNAHPDFRGARFDLECEHVVVVGNGNVAIDVARIPAALPRAARHHRHRGPRAGRAAREPGETGHGAGAEGAGAGVVHQPRAARVRPPGGHLGGGGTGASSSWTP